MTIRYLDEAQKKWVRAWWAAIHPQEEGRFPHSEFRALGRAARAQLKRCTGVDELVTEAAALRLAVKLLEGESGKSYSHFSNDYAVMALVAGALSGVRSDSGDGRSLAARLGGERPAMSELRFLRLMRTNDVDDFYRQLRRAIQLANREVDVGVLADDIIAWRVERDRPPADPNRRLKARWARDYYLTPSDRASLDKSIESATAESFE